MPKMESLMNLIFYSCLILVACTSATQVSHEKSCSYWGTMATKMSTMRSVQLNCEVNDQCNGLDCTGAFKYNLTFLPNFQPLHVDFCTGVRLNHCDDPVSMDIYMQVPKKHVDFVHRVHHNESIQVPGLNYSAQALGKADVFFMVELVPIPDHVLFSLTMKVRLFVAMFNRYTWPEVVQKQLIDEHKIPVSPCLDKTHIVNEAVKPAQCIATEKNGVLVSLPIHPGSANNKDSTTILPSTLSSVLSSVVANGKGRTTPTKGLSKSEMIKKLNKHAYLIVSRTYGKGCELHLLGTCHRMEICKTRGYTDRTRNGRCDCLRGMEIGPSGYCELVGQNGQDNDIRSQLSSGHVFYSNKMHMDYMMAGKNSAKGEVLSGREKLASKTRDHFGQKATSKLPIVIGSIAGSVVFMMLIIGLIAFAIKRSRSRYTSQELLLDSDEMIM